jgi:integrase
LASSSANDEVKAILTVLEFSGAHAKEICLLTASDIHTEADIPWFRIGVNSNRKILKTGGARHRSLPMLPEVVDVFRRYPNGFPTYARSGGSEAFSATANKLIKPIAEGATTYSFRHRMVDLLRNSKCDHALIQEIVGHNGGITGDYGEGAELEIRLEALQNAMAKAKQKQQLIKQD